MIRYDPSTSLSTPTTFEFPFQPYQIQQDFMVNLYSVLENKEFGIFESPTGTGKSLSLTCGALKWLCDHENLVKQQLAEDIDQLTVQIRDEEKSNEVNWLESQHEVIVKKESLLSLKKIVERLAVHDKDMVALKERRAKENRAKVRYKGAKPNESTDVDDGLDKGEDDEFLIENYDDRDEEEEEGEENKKYPGVQIFFCSRTHSQLTQVVNAIKSTVYGKTIRVVSLASRQNYCINDAVRKLNSNSLINDRCLELQKKPNSQPTQLADGRPIKKKKNDSVRCCFYSKQAIANLRDESLADILDIEDLVKVSRSEKGCPYYSSRLAAKDAHVVMIPYQMLLHKRTRVQSGLNLANSIVIIDEAHNLVDSLTSVYSAEVTLAQLQASRDQLDAYKSKYSLRFSSKNLLKINQLIFVTKQLVKLLSCDPAKSSTRMVSGYDLMVEADFFNIKVNDILDFCEKTRLPQKVQGFSQKFGTSIAVNTTPTTPKTDAKSFLKQLAEKKLNSNKSKAEVKETVTTTESPKTNDPMSSSSLRLLLKFLECLVENIDDGRVLLSYNTSVKSKSSMKYVLLNPSGHFNDILNECRSVIVAGGTMQPISEFKNQLFASHRERVRDFSYSHVVPKENVLPLVVSSGPSNAKFSFNFTNRLNKEMLNDLSSTLRNVCNVVPGGVVCFFSSYDYMETFYSFLEEVKGLEEIRKKKTVFKEPRLSGQVEKMLADYATATKSKTGSGAILFSVVGGKLSEGMNFSDDLARCVIVIGMPYPNKNSPELVEKMAYLDRKFGSGSGAEYYENICMKSVNQCIGRAVRHINDYASVLLIDERYSQRKIIEKLPTWISNSLQCAKGYGMVQSSLVKFFKCKRV